MSKNNTWQKESKRFLKGREWKLLKSITYDNFEKKCLNCNSTDNIHLDHIVPRFKNKDGSRWLDITNVQPLCEKCNCSVKGIKETDYRTDEFKENAISLIPLVEKTFKMFNLSTIIDVEKNKKITKKVSDTGKFKNKIKKFIILNTTFNDVITKFKINKNTPNYRNILLFIKQRIVSINQGSALKIKRMNKKQLEQLEYQTLLEKNKKIRRGIKRSKKDKKKSVICNP